MFHPTDAEYTLFSAAHRIKQVLISTRKLKLKYSFILSCQNGVKLDINSKRNYRNSTNTWRFNNKWIIEEIEKI
jgi:hypothetical protein